MIEIREANYYDGAALGTIMAASFRSAFGAFISRETIEACAIVENCQKMMENLLAEGKMRFLLGLSAGYPAGELVWAEGETPSSAEIMAIHSLPETWGTGLGAAMLRRALGDMEAAGKRRVSLWAFQANSRARRFYEKHGFSFDGTSRPSEFDGAVEVRYVRELAEKPKVLVSACLLGENCKYNGGNNKNAGVAAFLADKEAVPICPEMLAGLGVPRTPVEIVNGVLTDREGRSVDTVLREAAELAVTRGKEMDVHQAVLQSRSPTCGVNQVYDGSFSGVLVSGSGVFAQALMEAGFRVTDAEDVVETIAF